MGNNVKAGVVIAVLAVLGFALGIGIMSFLGNRSESTVVPTAATSAAGASSSVSQAGGPATSAASQSGQATGATSAQEEPNAESSTTEQAEYVVATVDDIRIEMPASYDKQGFYWKTTEHNLQLCSPECAAIVELFRPGTQQHGNEAKFEVHKLAAAGAGAEDYIILDEYYIENGELVYWGNKDANVLGTEIAGLTLGEIVSWVRVNQGGNWVEVAIRPEEGAQAAAPAESAAAGTFTTPFWGVWVGASKDEAEAQAQADELTAAGFDGRVFITTDWSNLNTERWYVVTAGISKSESEAGGLCTLVQEAGYDGAYVKYSGDYVS